MSFTIQLNNLKFFSFHGIHEEEKILGNYFLVSVSVSFQCDEKISTIEQTINYESVYNLIKKRMGIPTALLETLAQDLAITIHANDNRINSIFIYIEKKNPPIPNMEGSVGVSFKKDF